MDKREPWKNPGFVVSGGVHALAFLFLIVNFSHAPKLEEPIETLPVEMITTSDLNQIMNGEKNAKQMPVSQRRVDKVAELEDHKDAPPTPDAKKDTPPDPTPDKLVIDPGQAEPKPLDPKPPEPLAAVPPPPAPPQPETPSAPPPPAAAPPPPPPPIEKVETPPPAPVTPPTPPERPVEKAEAPPPEDKPPPPDAEPVMPPPRPKVEPPKETPKHAEAKPKKEAKKPPPKPPTRPVKLAKVEPEPVVPPPPTPRPEPKPDKLFDKVASMLDRMKPDKPLDKVASLLDRLKPDLSRPQPQPRPEPVKVEPPKPEPQKPVERPRSGNEVKEAKPRDDFNPDKIAAMLSHEAPQRKDSTGRSLAQVASLGSPTAHAEKMSPSVAAQLDGWLIDHYRGCWSYFGLGATQDYVPTVRIHMAQDGSLIGAPSIINPPRDPNLKSLADSALRAVNKCNPLPIPERFRPYYDQGYRQRVVRFDPKEMS